MASQGAAAVVQDAPQPIVDSYQHVQEASADFGTTFTAIYFGPW